MVLDSDTEPDVDLYAYLLVIRIVWIQIVQILFDRSGLCVSRLF
jgi:hypothetical protein